MEKLAATREPAILLVGRPYNLYDGIVNLELPRKLRDLYGVNVVPLEFLAADDSDLEAINSNMFWSYGRKILAGARGASSHPDLHLIYVTNFKCGPDSYIKHFVRDAFGRAFLTLQFDGHANDAGMLTRVEAYLDSQGILRRWTARAREREDSAPIETGSAATAAASMIEQIAFSAHTPYGGCEAGCSSASSCPQAKADRS
jgi:predicted nucleotide-binding protein (sugar kinase/HSP70/actin superfamily)